MSSPLDLKQQQKQEQFALKLSIAGTLFMAALGFGFAYLTNSDAVMLDGVFSLVGFTMSLLTLFVSKLVIKPDDDTFNFGYAHFEPLLNVFKSIIVLTICVVALVAAIDAILAGGRQLKVGSALIYAVIATGGCFVIGVYMHRAAKATGSSLVAVDAKGWLIDGILSAAVCLTFLAVFLLQDSPIAHYLPYADPGLVAVLVIISLPIPFKILKDNLREVLIMAPKKSKVDEINQHLAKATEPYQFSESVIRIMKYGRQTCITAHFVLDKDYLIDDIDTLDKIRSDLWDKMKAYDNSIIIDMVFTGDIKWAI